MKNDTEADEESLVYVVQRALFEMQRQNPGMEIEEFELPDERFVRDLYVESGGPTPAVDRIAWLKEKFKVNFVVKKPFKKRLAEKLKAH